MKQVKIPKLKPEEKEQIIKNYFQKKEGEKKVVEVLEHTLQVLLFAFMVVCNILVTGIFFIVALRTKSAFTAMITVSAITTSVLICSTYVKIARSGTRFKER